MLPLMCKPEVKFYDKTKTTAEIITNFYSAIYEASKPFDAIILGCNTVGHLGAELMQHRTFYDIDADCVGILGPISWKYNKQWTEVLANSGSPLFISAKPEVMVQKNITITGINKFT